MAHSCIHPDAPPVAAAVVANFTGYLLPNYLSFDRNSVNADVTDVTPERNGSPENFHLTVNRRQGRTGDMDMSTASTDGARSHARAQAQAADMRIPATPTDIDPGALIWAEAVPAGSYATTVLGRGSRLRLVDPDGGACAHLLLFRADAPWERLSTSRTR